MTWWWLSFCDRELPKGNQFLGVVIVEGSSLVDATRTAHTKGINPGGEVLGIQIPGKILPLYKDEWRNRILTKVEVHDIDAEIEAQL